LESLDETVPGDDESPGTLDANNRDRELTRIHNYVLLQRVGEGGMGVVYAAYDQMLDRKVAIKLLRVGTRGAARLLREAQALARLSHPNVVQVYEVGEFEQAAFIAMEFVDGRTLGTWLRETTPTRAEILAVFAAAGRGLVAAHDKGLVHRDFKPENVMVSDDGRVVVMDFGLARGRDTIDESLEHGSQTGSQPGSARAPVLTSSELTATGAVMGTPAYMSPEQYAGAGTSPASDQFGFCVTLWEALCGQRPFAGQSLFVLQEAISQRRFSEPATSELPSWLRKVLERGLSPNPADRWPTMTALLAALADDPTRRRRWLSATLAAVLVIVGGGSWANEALEHGREKARARAQAERRAACEQASLALTSAWNEQTRAQLAQAFAATKRGESGEAWSRTAARLDEYARQWSSLHERACVEVEVDGTRELDSATRVHRCLAEDQSTFEALLDAWKDLDDEMVSRAPEAAAELPLPSMCANEAWLAQQVPPPEDAATRSAVVELRARLERVAARQLAADYETALLEAQAVLVEAEALGWLPLEVEARLAVGDLQEKRGQMQASRDSLRQAFFDAGHAGYDLVALDAASKLTWTVGVGQLDAEQGLLWGDIGAMLVERMQLRGTIHEAKLINAIAATQYRQGDNPNALANYLRSYEIRRAEFGPQHPLVAASLNNIGLLQTGEGKYQEALVSLRAAHRIRVHTLGPQHPSVAGSLNNIALTLQEQGQYAAALEVSRQAVPILEAALGSQHPSVGASLSNMGVIQNYLGDYEGALASHRRGLEIKLAAQGPDHATIAISLSNIGEAQRNLGQLEAARESLEAAYAVRDQASRMPAQRGEHAFSLAQVLGELGEEQRAVELAKLAIADFIESGEGKADERAKVEAWLAARPKVER
jgi:tetratricopeptide (TPR) repeat protein/predicted Ser/Thr protein kinase